MRQVLNEKTMERDKIIILSNIIRPYYSKYYSNLIKPDYSKVWWGSVELVIVRSSEVKPNAYFRRASTA